MHTYLGAIDTYTYMHKKLLRQFSKERYLRTIASSLGGQIIFCYRCFMSCAYRRIHIHVFACARERESTWLHFSSLKGDENDTRTKQTRPLSLSLSFSSLLSLARIHLYRWAYRVYRKDLRWCDRCRTSDAYPSETRRAASAARVATSCRGASLATP